MILLVFLTVQNCHLQKLLQTTIIGVDSFGCLCFPWLLPCNSNKLKSKSQPCIFVGCSPSQYAYRCLDPITNKIYTSRNVVFYDNQLPYMSLIKPSLTIKQNQNIHLHLPHSILPINPTTTQAQTVSTTSP